MKESELSNKAQSEQTALRASINVIRAERMEIDAQNLALTALIEREEKLRRQLMDVLATSRAERQAIELEKFRILSSADR